MRKILTKEQKIKKNNKKKIVLYFCTAKLFKFISILGGILCCCFITADIRYSSIPAIIIGISSGITICIVFGYLSQKIQNYLYSKRKYILKIF